jgi:hypothetical protein
MQQSDLDLLQMIPSSHLQALVKTRRVPLAAMAQSAESSDSASLPILEIAQYLFASSVLREIIAGLEPVAQHILRELVACGGRANSRDLALYLTGAGLLGPAKRQADEISSSPERESDLLRFSPPGSTVRYPAAHPHGAFEQALRYLLGLGLLFWGKQTNFSGRDYVSGIHDGVLIVPLCVREEVKSVLAPEEDPQLAHDITDVAEGARALQRSLYLYWSLVASLREGLTTVNNGLLARSSLRQVVEHMGNKGYNDPLRMESDAPRLLFIRLLLMRLGLLREQRTTLYASPAEAFFSLPLLERMRRCCHVYLENPFWNEMAYLPDVNVRPGPALLEPAHEEVMRARQTVAGRIIHEQVGQWSGLAVLVARTKLYAPYLLFPRQYGPRGERYSSGSNPYGWDFRLRHGWLTHREGWHLVEGAFVRAVVSGPLHWLGLVELDNEAHPSEFRLSSAAAAIMSIEPLQDDGALPAGRLVVQPNFELVALAPVSEALLVRLDRFAELLSLEHVAQYRLTKASITRAIQMGLHAETIQQELEQGAGGEIPQNVRYSLSEWERQARRVEVWRSATLLEVEDPALLDAFFENQETRLLFNRRLTPVLAEVALHQLPAVQELLWQRDYLPMLTTTATQDISLENGRLAEREAQWRLHPDGLLQPFSAVLDLFLVSEVARFSESDEATGWRRITPASLQRALAQDISLEHIVRFLQHYCEGGVPGSLLIRLKLWGGGYGETAAIHVEQIPMLRLSSQVLQDLQSDEDLKELLGAEVEQHSRLVRVDAAHLEKVRELLRTRGFEVE